MAKIGEKMMKIPGKRRGWGKNAMKTDGGRLSAVTEAASGTFPEQCESSESPNTHKGVTANQ